MAMIGTVDGAKTVNENIHNLLNPNTQTTKRSFKMA